MSQTDPDRPRPRTQLRLHAERTADPDTIRFVIAALGWSPDGRWTPEAPDGCPGKLAQLLEQGRLARIEVRGEQAHLTRCRPGDQWATLAPVCRTVILEEIDAVDDLARARNIVARSTGEVALSHGGGLRIVSLRRCRAGRDGRRLPGMPRLGTDPARRRSPRPSPRRHRRQRPAGKRNEPVRR